MNVRKPEIDDIYIILVTSQFLLDFSDEKLEERNGWVRQDVKQTLKTLVRKLEKVCNVPFVTTGEEISLDVKNQHYQGSQLAENIFKVMMKAGTTLSEEEQLKFQLSFENLCSRFRVN